MAFVTATGLTAAIFNQGIDWFRERGVRSRKSSYLGLQLAYVLETYISDSLDWHSDMADLLSQNDTPNKLGTGELAEYPNDPDSWASFPKKLAGKVLNFRLNLISERRYLANISTHIDPHSAAEEYCNSCIETSFDAWLLAKELREFFGFPEHGPVNEIDSSSNIGPFLENKMNQIKNRKERGITI